VRDVECLVVHGAAATWLTKSVEVVRSHGREHTVR